MKLLIVEDHPGDRKLLRIQLEAEGHNVVEAVNVQEALAALEQGGIDGVISDIFMPGMDGFQLCHEIRRRPTDQATIPLVLYSGTFFSAADQQLAGELGANGFVRKPASPAVILAALRARHAIPAGPAAMQLLHVPDGGVMEKYGRALARKLEERNEQLQHSLVQIHRAHEAILELNHTVETQVAQRAAALEAASQELAASSHRAACEFKSPLRVITDNLQQLEQSLATQATDLPRKCIDRIANACRHITQLADSLSESNRPRITMVGRARVDLDALVDEAITAVRCDAPERKVQWERCSLPQVAADPELLRQVLVTLLRNAMTFSCAKDPAIIEIGHRKGRIEETVIFVRDNGIGCDAGEGETDRASPRGFGLAEVHRIVGSHGGRVWFETDVGRGSTFYFSLPRLDAS